MTIEYDPERRRATDRATGLAVEWVRDEPPMERQIHFKLIFNGRETPFIGHYDFGEHKIREAHPDMHFLEQDRLVLALREKNYRAGNIRHVFDIDLFLRVWRHLVSQRLSAFRVSTYYSEFHREDGPDMKRWSCEG